MKTEYQIGQLWGIVLAAGEGSRVRVFLSDLCGGRGIKQFCAILEQRSLVQATLDRVERLIARRRIVVVVSQHHREEVAQQLKGWPAENIIFQPDNRDTTAGLLLPLAYVAHRDPLATVAIFPSDHFILQEERFMEAVRHGVRETQTFPWNMTLLGILSEGPKDGYGWILPGKEEKERETRAVREFWEKPTQAQTQQLWQQGALLNTFVCIAQSKTLWSMARRTTPEIYERFQQIQQVLGTPAEEKIITQMYTAMPAVNFCAGVCEPSATELRVLPAPDVGWSDWGTAERIWATVEQLGRQAELLTRLKQSKGTLAQLHV
jgi:mannose-1-phosphate guanylyltransferase